MAAIDENDSAAEVGDNDLQRRARIGAAVVAADAGHVRDVLGAMDRFVADRPEVQLLASRQRLALGFRWSAVPRWRSKEAPRRGSRSS